MTSVRPVLSGVAKTLREGAALVCDGKGHPVEDLASIRTVQKSAEQLVELVDAELDAEISALSAEAFSEVRTTPSHSR